MKENSKLKTLLLLLVIGTPFMFIGGLVSSGDYRLGLIFAGAFIVLMLIFAPVITRMIKIENKDGNN